MIGSRSGGRGHAKKDKIGECVALAVVIEEEKKLFTDDRTAEVSSELVEVIGGFSAAVDFIDWVVGIQALVAEEFKGRTVEAVSPVLGNHVHHFTACVSELGGIAGGVDLYFLLRVVTELVGSAARTA